MKLSKTTTTIIIGCLLVIFIGLALLLRIALPYDSVFTGGWVKFTSNDAYYHMRVVDTLVHNFPHMTQFDPFFIYPGGGTSGGVHFFDWFLAVIIWVIGLGSPSQHLIDVIGAYFPTFLAALTVIPVFFIGKALFNRWIGVLAAFLVAILPGEFMGRSILGFTDNHVAETLFSSLVVMFLILALKAAGSGENGQPAMTSSNVFKREGKSVTKPLVYALLAGIFMGIYLITWMGALLFIFIMALYFVIQFIINHLKGKSSDHLGIIGFIVFVVALIIFLPFSPDRNLSLAMLGSIFIPPVLFGLSKLFSGRKLATYFYPLALAVGGVALVFILRAIDAAAVTAMWNNFLSVFAPGGGSTATTTMEMQPFLSPQGTFSTAVAWGNFTTSFFLIPSWPLPGFALISLLILLWVVIKQRGDKEPHVLFVIWSVVILFATLVQRRFAYYFVVNVSVLSAYITWQMIWYAGLRKLADKPEKSAAPEKPVASKGKAKKQSQSPARRESVLYYAYTIFTAIVIIFFVCFWNITKSVQVASSAPFAPSDGWEESLRWMKDNTPDPMGDPQSYYKLYGLDFKYPASAYGVAAWWDYGYWISRTAHRFPSTNPSQDPKPITQVANLFLTTDEAAARKLMADLGSSYVITDFELTTSKLWAVVDWARQDQNKYFSVYYVQGRPLPVQVFTPDYYRTLAVRLFNFNGKAVTNEKPVVITYEDKIQNGFRFKQVTAADEYPSYKAAQDYVATQKAGKYDIVGINPFVSPVPLAALQDYKLIYSSNYRVSFSANTTTSDIKIFQLLK